MGGTHQDGRHERISCSLSEAPLPVSIGSTLKDGFIIVSELIEFAMAPSVEGMPVPAEPGFIDRLLSRFRPSDEL